MNKVLNREIKTLEEVVSPGLSELGIHGTYEVIAAPNANEWTLKFTNEKDQFLYELHGGPQLFKKLHTIWGQQFIAMPDYNTITVKARSIGYGR